MSLSSKIQKSSLSILRRIYSAGPFPGVAHPVFILGCGRSGTTILGKVLSKHGKIAYLNEPRDLWSSAYPETDIWTSKACTSGGRIHLSAADAVDAKSRRIRRMFRFETLVSGRPLLIEKLPINNFRLGLIRAIFPDARYIHIYRNGLEVASSIATANKTGDWFGSGGYKWHKLVEYARAEGNAGDAAALCATDLEKGLLEWRLSTEAAISFLAELPNTAFFELSYEEFVTHPANAVARIFRFVGVHADAEIEAFVTETVSRRSDKVDERMVSEKLKAIGGRLLPLSMKTNEGLTKRPTGEDPS
jgi:LPS sulfotransferase NodH